MKIEWVEPNEEHPMKGYAVLSDGDESLTATVTLEYWPVTTRSGVEERLKDYWRAGLRDTPKIPDRPFLNPDEFLPTTEETKHAESFFETGSLMRTAYANLNKDGSISIHGVRKNAK